MNTLQQYQLWIGLGFAILLVIFLIVAFFFAKTLTDDQRSILRFLSALCAGFAGALIAGEALFKMDSAIGAGTNLAISGTSGCALFFTIWFSFKKVAGFPDAVNYSVPDGWTFKQMVDYFAERDGAVPVYDGFKPEELNAPLRVWQVHTKSTSDAIRLLRSITTETDAIRKYDVKLEDSTYRLSIHN